MDTAFSNEPIDVSGLPRLSDGDFVPMHPNFLRVAMIGRFLLIVSVVAVAATVLALAPDVDRLPVFAIAGTLIALTLVSLMLQTIEVRNTAYQVRQHDLSYRRGVIVKRVQTLPFVRVQHARIRQGPVQRIFKLATLHINSAGPDIAIAGLHYDDAVRLRSLVVERAGDLVEEQ